MNIQQIILSTMTLALALVFGFILIQTLMYIFIPVDRGAVRAEIPKEEAPPWSYQYRYQNWIYALPGPGRVLPPSSPYVPGIGRVWRV